MNKKILITTESLNIGGVETSLLSLIKELKKYKVEIDLKVLKKGQISEEFEKNCNVEIIPTKQFKKNLLNRVLKNLRCKSLLKKYKNNKDYDIAIAYYGINNYSDMYVAASNAKKKFIWVHCNFHDLYRLSKYKTIIKLRNKIISKKFAYFDKIIAVSESARKGFITEFPKYSSKVSVINNLFSTERLNKKNEDVSIDIKGNNNLVYIGRLDKLKNVDFLIREFQKVVTEIEDAKLYIIGDGPEMNNLKFLSKQLGLENKIIFLGMQKNPFKFLDKMNVNVSASKAEAYATNLIESLAMNKYFVSAANNGAKDIFYETNNADLNNGIICESEYIHYHILYYLKNQQKIIPNFDIKTFNQKILCQIEEMLKIEK